ncbi:MAG: malto-oligosyltrehalose synthase [Steroidobacteraceae bacterium]
MTIPERDTPPWPPPAELRPDDPLGAAPRAQRPRRAIIPRATYRIQLSAAFTFRDATALVPYFCDLGVSHIYCSPYLRARPGSSHGYDIVDHNSLNPEIGDRDDLERFVAALRSHRMGQILDFVPNHVGIMGAENTWWMDVLENGEASIYAQFFDIDWHPVNPALAGKVLVPVLGDHYGEVLERGELELRFECAIGAFAVFYHEHRFPLDPRDYPSILERALEIAPPGSLSDLERTDVSSLATAFTHLPERSVPTPAATEERNRDKEVHKRRLAALCAGNAAFAESIATATRVFAGRLHDAASWNALHALLEAQAYRLAYWRVASDEINYRRFFDVNDLAALRMENETVFEATHGLILELIARGEIDGLRIDHPDGLYDPAGYFRRLQRRAATITSSARNPDSTDQVGVPAASCVIEDPAQPLGAQELPLYVIAEKITAGFERLPEDWLVHGTTGYGFANVVNGLFIDGGAKARLDRIYRAFVGEPLEWASVAYEAKRFIVGSSLAAELNVIAYQLARIAGASRRTRDLTLASLRAALTEIIACFPVYRTYIVSSVSSEDRRYIDWALSAARRRGTAIDSAVFDFVRSILLGEDRGAEPSIAGTARAFTMKLQQLTAPVTAKGIEDTAFYRFNRLVSLNEVGGEPDTFGATVRAFHADAQQRARRWPHELLASSTHDTKRSEDVRARINVLSEAPGEWRGALERWRRMNRARRREVDGLPAPSPNDEYLLYETLLGTLPLEASEASVPADYCGRIEVYMLKAVREAKLRSSWSGINSAYEAAVQEFIRGILDPRPNNLFLADLAVTVRRLGRFGLFAALSQTLCKLTAPGVPDIYQGTELWDFSLVDPDNRRPVDYGLRQRQLAELRGWTALPAAETAAHARALLDTLPDGRAKLYVIARTLQWRRTHERLFSDGDYIPLRTAGPYAAHLCAFARRRGSELAVTVAPRLYRKLLDSPLEEEWPLGRIWSDTRVELTAELSAATLTNLFDGARVSARPNEGRHALPVREVLESFPVALLAATL